MPICAVCGVPDGAPPVNRMWWRANPVIVHEMVYVVSQRLGHASPVITLSVYAHVMPGNQRQAADLFARLVREASGQ